MNNQQNQPFDPWTATKAARQRVARAGLDALLSGGQPEENFHRLKVWAELCLLAEEFPDKSNLSDLAIMQRMKQCYENQIALPAWLIKEFCKRGTLEAKTSKHRNTRFVDGLKLYAAKKSDERSGKKRPLDEASMTNFCKEIGIEGIAGEPGSYGQKAYYTFKRFFDSIQEYERRGEVILNKMLAGE